VDSDRPRMIADGDVDKIRSLAFRLLPPVHMPVAPMTSQFPVSRADFDADSSPAIEQRDGLVSAWEMNETDTLIGEPGYRWTRGA